MRERIRGLWKVLFGRTTIFVFLILIQLAVIIGGIGLLGKKEILIANYVVGVLAIIILIYLINNRLNSSFKLMWIILIVATPLIGVPFFLYTRLQPGTRYIARRVDEQINDQRPWLLPENDTVDRLIIDSGNEYGLFKYMYESLIREMSMDCSNTCMRKPIIPCMMDAGWSIFHLVRTNLKRFCGT